MPTIADVRAQFPQYSDLSDQQLADGLYKKFYSDLPRDQFDQKIGLAAKGPDFAGDFAPNAADRPQMQPAMNAAAQAAAPPMAWGDVAKGAAANALPSAGQFAGDIYSAVRHPIQTGENVLNLVKGVVEKAIPGEQPQEKYADAVGHYLANRYGGWENLKRTMATDPVGFLADASTVLSGGETLAAKLPALAKAADIANTVTRVVDPANAVAKGVGLAATAAGKVLPPVLGVSTGAGSRALETAARAGYEGGDASSTFLAHMRGSAPMEEAIDSAKVGLAAIKQQRQAAYQAGMADLSKDRTVLDFSKIEDAIDTAKPVKLFTGPSTGIKVSLQPSVQDTANQMIGVLKKWRNLPPEDFHTAEGIDALKQRLDDIRAAAGRGTPAEALATQVRNIVKDQIVQQAPEYARTMKSYEDASNLIKEIEGTLSLNRQARVDPQLRKLQSVLRDNANTNYGQRVKLAQLLQQNGATHLMEALAGQGLRGVEPRGLARGAAAGLTSAAPVVAAASTFNPFLAAGGLASFAMQSPRAMGEAAHGVGALARHAQSIPVRAGLRSLYELQAIQPEE